MQNNELELILQNAKNGQQLTEDDVFQLLSLDDKDDIGALFQAAQDVKERHFGRNVFLYGFVYFSTHCRNNCSFCFYRKSNHDSLRYRKSPEEVLELAVALEDIGVHVVDLTMGEDPVIHDGKGCENLIDLVQMVDDAIDTPLMVSPGVVPKDVFAKLKDAGTDWFACYQETHNRDLYNRLRPNQDYDVRLNQKLWAREQGILAEEGIMIGVGETLRDRARSIMVMRELGVQQVRAMTFVPQTNTPMQQTGTTPFIQELKTIAAMRLVHQDKLIPASLDIEGIGGLRPRLDAGANVITSIIPPKVGLAGVAQHELEIDSGERYVDHIQVMLEEMGISVASESMYRTFIETRKRLATEVMP